MSKLGDLEKMKVTELKTAAKAKGLSTVGTKKQLIERLLEATSSKSESTADDDDDEVNEDYVLGDGDETIEDDQKSGDLFINEDVMLSPVIKPKPISIKSPEKENKEVSPIILVSDAAKQDVNSETKVSPTVVKTLSEQERRELRAKRFNAAGDDKQKTDRAERFGLALKGNGSTTKAASGSAVNVVNNLEKLQMRASRFGVVSATSLVKSDDKDRILKRKARFGIGTSVGLSADEEERKKKRAERFGMK